MISLFSIASLMKKKSPLVVGNWKMNKTSLEAKEFVSQLVQKGIPEGCRALLAVPFTAIEGAVACASSQISIGAQNMHDQVGGAFTGEISAEMLRVSGAKFVLLGHSERRAYFCETNEWVGKKVEQALLSGLMPILCIGESLEERETGAFQAVLETQLSQCLAFVPEGQIDSICIAYEPIWAIGTGKTATVAMAQEALAYVRQWVSHHFSKECGRKVELLYGGSVTRDNVSSLIAQPDIDGVLVGGASLDLEHWMDILKSVMGELL